MCFHKDRCAALLLRCPAHAHACQSSMCLRCNTGKPQACSSVLATERQHHRDLCLPAQAARQDTAATYLRADTRQLQLWACHIQVAQLDPEAGQVTCRRPTQQRVRFIQSHASAHLAAALRMQLVQIVDRETPGCALGMQHCQYAAQHLLLLSMCLLQGVCFHVLTCNPATLRMPAYRNRTVQRLMKLAAQTWA